MFTKHCRYHRRALLGLCPAGHPTPVSSATLGGWQVPCCLPTLCISHCEEPTALTIASRVLSSFREGCKAAVHRLFLAMG